MEFQTGSLKESNDLLYAILDNINSAIFLINSETRIISCNRAFTNLFGTAEEDTISSFFGNAMGCAYTNNNAHKCGTTSECQHCRLRKNILNPLNNQTRQNKQKLVKEFTQNNQNVTKFLEYTTKQISLNHDQYTLVIIDDNTEDELLQKAIVSKTEELAAKNVEIELAYEKLQQEEVKLLKLEQQNSVMAMIVTANHEINQPLAVLKGNLGLLQVIADRDGCSNCRKYIDKANKAVGEIADILKKYRESEIDFDIGDYTQEIKMVNFKKSQLED